MNQLQVFKNSKFGEVRVATTETGDPIFCLADICNAVSLTNPSTVIKRLDDDEVVKYNLGRDNQVVGNSIANYVTESGFYNVLLFSSSPNVKPFRKWVTSEVLPSIRKHGAYMTSQIIEKALTDPDTIIQLATNLKEERKQKELLKEKLKIQEHVIKESAPKVEYYENVLQSESLISTNIIAKDMGMSAPSLNRLLKRLGVIYRSGKTWVLYHRFQSFGYTGTRTFDYIDKNGVKQTAIHTYWTEKGREFVIGQVKIWDEKYKRAIGGR